MTLSDHAIEASIDAIVANEMKARNIMGQGRKRVGKALEDFLWKYRIFWLCPEDSSCPDFDEATGCSAKHHEKAIAAFFND